ncbi:MAG: hypothetical protein JKY49_18340 [Cohaesibacteraceae bacterium]|nr:hypothetical protein [Cohaesibacteraceae bacterium]
MTREDRTGIEQQLGQVQGHLGQLTDLIKDQAAQSTRSRRQLYDKIDGMDKTITGLGHRLQTLEQSFVGMQPTLQEFVTFKERARGAGMLGRVLWVSGGVVLASVSWVVTQAADLFTKG